MPKFREGDMVYFTRPSLNDTDTEYWCGLEDEMNEAIGGEPLTVCGLGNNNSYQSYNLSSPLFTRGQNWWFHENDLEYFNLSFENK